MTKINVRNIWKIGNGPNDYHSFEEIQRDEELRERVLSYWRRFIRSPKATNDDRAAYRDLLKALVLIRPPLERAAACVDALNKKDLFTNYHLKELDCSRVIQREFAKQGFSRKIAPAVPGSAAILKFEGSETIAIDYDRDGVWRVRDEQWIADVVANETSGGYRHTGDAEIIQFPRGRVD